MQRTRSIMLMVTVFAVVMMGASFAAPASAGCKSCQGGGFFNSEVCWPDDDGYTKCSDGGPRCVDEEIAGSLSCGDEDDGGGGSDCPPECEPYDET